VIANWDSALSFVLRREGGFVDHPHDPGGPTKYGITSRVFDKWRMLRAEDRESVESLSLEEASAIYKAWYWDAIGGPELPDRVDLAVFDAAVNLGPVPATRLLQRAAWTESDGILGPETIMAVRAIPVDCLLWAFLTLRREYYLGLKSETFQKGWLNRLDHVRAAVSV